MNNEQLMRYARHIMLPEIDLSGQERLLSVTVLIVGIGGLGSASALYLAASGIGRIIIADFDTVELSNLQRQIIHHQQDIKRLKVDSAAQKMTEINPHIDIKKISDINEKTLSDAIYQADIVLDGTDNFKTRFFINKLCFDKQRTLISASVIRFEGQLSVFQAWQANEPCYQCLYQNQGDDEQTCVNSGVLAPMAGVIGSLQALQCIKVLLNLSEQLIGKLLLVDGLSMNSRTLSIEKDSNCLICHETS